MNKTLLITGGAGFVGSNLAVFIKQRWTDCRVVCLDNLHRAGSELNLARLQDAGIEFVRADIRHKDQLLVLPKIDYLIECSAEPSVLKSYEDPAYTIDTSLNGTLNCLELARRDRAHVIYLSSSRVYPYDALNQVPYEETPTRFDWMQKQGAGYSRAGVTLDFSIYGAKSLYGATKLASELLLTEYMDMYGIRGVINRFGVIAGAWQMGRIDQGIIGFWILQHLLGRPLGYIGFGGTGKQMRDALHIDDVCELIFYQMEHIHSCSGRVYNAGGGRANTFSLMELTAMVSRITRRTVEVRSVPEQRKGDVRIYLTDNQAVTEKTGWSPKKDLKTICADTFQWMGPFKERLSDI
ncbi:MAG: NAD-dependent epimerase/dehydratase family protein [Candidatus Omnitrophota bacterium]